nr:hypothetical protein [Parapedobacter tibetensis]
MLNISRAPESLVQISEFSIRKPSAFQKGTEAGVYWISLKPSQIAGLFFEKHGIHQYPDANNILHLCDAGGANSYRHHVFKKELMRFSEQTGLSVIVCHYPPYCSKWNPIEHRLFSPVHRTMGGVHLLKQVRRRYAIR